jgi:oligopeptide transport system substrate-binding protein
MRGALVPAILIACGLAGCGRVWNDPYPAEDRGKNIYYSFFVERPRHFDPAQSYTSDEYDIIQQIYEPPFQYHYLKRPYQLVSATATEVPRPRYYDERGRELSDGADAARIAYSEYDIRIRRGIMYQPHPALARDGKGEALYLSLPESEIRSKYTLSDFPKTGTRELVADDYVYEIKRLAHPQLVSPIYGHMTDYIVGLKELGDRLKRDNDALVAEYQKRYGTSDPGRPWIDLRAYDLAGVKVLDRYTYRVRIKGKYPQFLYWLAMPFFAPIPWEADRFYSQRGMNDGRNLTLDSYPVGTGPYMLSQYDPNFRMTLDANPNFHGESYPAEGAPGDGEEGLLADAGKRVPFSERIVFTREKESIPLWNKFLQGYYDTAGIASDNFDQAVRVGVSGETALTPEMQQRGIRLVTAVEPTTYYLAFNFNDPVVGAGKGDERSRVRARKLRQALSIAIDWEEFISIFQNGRGVAGMGPLPPGIFGYREDGGGYNPVVYDQVGGRPLRKPVAAAKKLLAEAGYPDGRDEKTGRPLVLYLDTTDRGPDSAAQLSWYRRQFAKIDVQLEIRATDWNRFQEKVRLGNTQMFFLGWHADYPDPENFMFLLYGPNGTQDGENKARYANPEFDRLFERMRNMESGPQRQTIIDQMVKIAREDAPWTWGFHPKTYALAHVWVRPGKPNVIARNTLKYARVDPVLRERKRDEWNRPVVWPLGLILAALLLASAPAYLSYRRRERMAARPAGVPA